MAASYRDIITVEPGKRSGKPCIRGIRMTVYNVLSYLAAGMTHEEIIADFPSLTEEDILACLSYAAERERQTLVARAYGTRHRLEYNHRRPHSALGYRTPAEFAAGCAAASVRPTASLRQQHSRNPECLPLPVTQTVLS